MVVRITLLTAALGLAGLAFAGWLVGLLYLRGRHLAALRRARELAERLRRPALTLAEVEEQSAALEELAQLRDTAAAVEAARELLGELDGNVRNAALEVLRKTRALERWVRELRRGRYAIRLRAIEALGQVGDERAIDALVDALGDDDPDVVRALARAVLARDRDYASDRLADALASPGRRVAETAASVLVEMGEEAVEPLLSQLVSTHPQARRLSVGALRAIGDCALVPALRPLLDTDPDPEVRVAVLEAIAHLDRTACDPFLRRCTQEDPDWFVRARACTLLAEVDAPGAADFLRAQLAERSASLPHPRGDDAVEPVLEGEERVLNAIIVGLRTLGVSDEEIVRTQREAAAPPLDLLAEATSEHSQDLGVYARALEARNPVTRAETVRELSALGPRTRGYLQQMLRDPDPMVRAEAARGLSRVGAICCLQALSTCLQDPDQEVRLAVAAAVRAIVTRDAARELQS